MAPNKPPPLLAIPDLISSGPIAPAILFGLYPPASQSPQPAYNGVRPLLILPLGLVKFAQGPLNLRVAQTALRFE